MPGTSPATKTTTPGINLKNPVIAGILAFLLPGAGHLYQGRLFKAALYFICILSTFGFGVSIGEGRSIYLYYYNRTDEKADQGQFLDYPADTLVLHEAQPNGQRQTSQRFFNYGYLAQVMVGLPALPGYFQNSRYNPGDYAPIKNELENGFTANFTGILEGETSDQSQYHYPTRGTVSLKMSDNQIETVTGQFHGSITTQDGHDEPVVLDLSGPAEIGTPVFADPKRTIAVRVSNPDLLRLDVARLIGSTPRSFVNWYAVPLEDATLQLLNRNLGKNWELAMVFTWIAGLLNILAIWDAVEGPAYGRGDEPSEDDAPQPNPA